MKSLMKKQCRCKRFILVKRPEFGTAPRPTCGYCKTYGLEKSLELKESFEKQFKK